MPSQNDTTMLFDDQKNALIEIEAFLKRSTSQVFILSGTTSSGKSFLIPYIRKIAAAINIHEVLVLAPSVRVANNLLPFIESADKKSLYSHIYGFNNIQPIFDEEDVADSQPLTDEESNESEPLTLKEIPIKTCNNSSNALFIVEEAQLVSDVKYEYLDLIFGSGRPLADLISFCELNSSNRKIIFIGDDFALYRDDHRISPLSSEYLQTQYKLDVSYFALKDKMDASIISREAYNCVKGIREKSYNKLTFKQNEQFRFLDIDAGQDCLNKMVVEGKNGCFICYTNEGVDRVNRWIKKDILRTENDLAVGDLVLFHNNISAEDKHTIPSTLIRIHNGQFASVLETPNQPISETVRIHKEDVTLYFREIYLRLPDSGKQLNVLSLENYRGNGEAFLTKKEIVAFNCLLRKQINICLKKKPFEETAGYASVIASEYCKSLQDEINQLKASVDKGDRAKTKLGETEGRLRKFLKEKRKEYNAKIELSLMQDPTSLYFKYKNAAFLKFGWAMTGHKAMGFKWDEVIINADFGDKGTHCDEYFRWLYSSICRARNKVTLVNYKPIHPLDQCRISDNNNESKSKFPFFISGRTNDKDKIAELRDFIGPKLQSKGVEISGINVQPWQVKFQLKKDATFAIVQFTFDGKGEFSMPFFDKPGFADEIIKYLKYGSAELDYSLIKDDWRRMVYEEIGTILASNQIHAKSIIQIPWKDRIRYVGNDNDLVVEIIYNSKGTIIKIDAKYYNSVLLWNKFKDAIIKIGGIN